MKVLIFGASGFIGSNIANFLSKYHIIDSAKLSESESAIFNKVKCADIIINASGISRSQNESDFFLYNIYYSQRLYSIINQHENKMYVYFSSIHYKSDSLYGLCKRYNEFLLKDIGGLDKNYLVCLRIPGIFGPGMKPNHVSVVATFCYNIANKKESKIIEGEKKIKLLYIDDLVKYIQDQIVLRQNFGFKLIDQFQETNEITVSELFESIKKISIDLDPMIYSTNFYNKLCKTFKSYLNK